MVINYAHRGASGYYPENTMLSFEKAVELGCDGIETDVHMTNDGVLVLIHDEFVNRTTDGIGLVKRYNFSEISKLDMGSWFDRKYKDQRIVTAEELIIFAKEKDIIINFELKTDVILYPEIEKNIIEIIYKYNMQSKIILSSFNPQSLFNCKEISRDIKAGILYSKYMYQPDLYCKKFHFDALHPNFHYINKEIIQNAQKDNILVNPYTVNRKDQMKKLIDAGVNGIITNYPDLLKIVLEEIK